MDPFFFGLWRKEYLLPNMTRTELSSSKYDAKNWTFEYDSKIFFQKKMTHRIQPLFFEYDQRIGFFSWIRRKELSTFFSWIWRTELNPLFSNLSRIELFSKNWTLYFWLDSKYWIFHFNYGSKNWTLSKWLKELYFSWMTLRTQLFFQVWLKMIF